MASTLTDAAKASPLGTIKRSTIDIASASGDQTILAGVEGKRLVVLAYIVSSSVDNGLTWKSESESVSGKIEVGALIPGGASYCPVGHFATGVGEDLILEVESTADVGGHIVYQES
jgi:hypothetical protein